MLAQLLVQRFSSVCSFLEVTICDLHTQLWVIGAEMLFTFPQTIRALTEAEETVKEDLKESFGKLSWENSLVAGCAQPVLDISAQAIPTSNLLVQSVAAPDSTKTCPKHTGVTSPSFLRPSPGPAQRHHHSSELIWSHIGHFFKVSTPSCGFYCSSSQKLALHYSDRSFLNWLVLLSTDAAPDLIQILRYNICLPVKSYGIFM